LYHYAPRTLLRPLFIGISGLQRPRPRDWCGSFRPLQGGSANVLARVLSQQIEETTKQTKVRFRDYAELLSFSYEIIVISVAVF